MYDKRIQCDTLLYMKLIAVRLPDEVAAVVEQEAAKQERSRSAVVVRALREALGIKYAVGIDKGVPGGDHTAVAVLDRETGALSVKIAEEKPKRERKACQHGDDPLTCRMPACRQARG